MMKIIPIVMYGLIYTVSERISARLLRPHIITVFTVTLYWTVLLVCLYQKGGLKRYGLCVPRHRRWSQYAACIPLLLAPILNIVLFEHGLSVLEMLLLIFASFGEEVLFRGLLLSELTGQYQVRVLKGMVITSCLFAVLHMGNLSAGVTVRYVLVQVFCAGAMGFCFAVITCRERSILPGILLHSLMNVTSPGIAGGKAAGAGPPNVSDLQTTVFLIAGAIYLLYGIGLYRKEKFKVQLERKDESVH